MSLWKGHCLVCVDATVLASAQRACHRTRHQAAPSQRALGLYLPGNEVMLHVVVGPESLIHDWAAMMGRSLIRHALGRNQPRKNTRHKPHPTQAYKRAA